MMRFPAAVAVVVLAFAHATVALRISGTFNSGEFFTFLAKFGFQKTELSNSDDTQGFIFGNATIKQGSEWSPHRVVSLVVLDRNNFLEYYGNRSLYDKSKACTKMFDKVSVSAYDALCNDAGQEDFIRTVPCQSDHLCPEEDNPANVVNGYQFTFRIQDSMQSRFWYVSMVSCVRNHSSCKWEPVDEHVDIEYDLWLVNGNPNGRSRSMARYQYSYDLQDLFGVFIFLFLVYCVLLPLQIHAHFRQRHQITSLLVAGVATEFLSLAFTCIHHAFYASNGRGVLWLEDMGEVLDIISRSLFMLLLLLLAMGWAVSRQELRCKTAIFSLWLTYAFVHVLLYVWKKTEVDVIEDIEEYQTVPGIIILFLRIIVMFCFLLSLRDTMLHEHSAERLSFFLHFGAASLVWFIYLPLMAIVALQINALWRTKFIISVTYFADTFAYAVLIHLLWPSRREQYFLLTAAEEDDFSAELDELSEAANHIHDSSGDDSDIIFSEKASLGRHH